MGLEISYRGRSKSWKQKSGCKTSGKCVENHGLWFQCFAQRSNKLYHTSSKHETNHPQLGTNFINLIFALILAKTLFMVNNLYKWGEPA